MVAASGLSQKAERADHRSSMANSDGQPRSGFDTALIQLSCPTCQQDYSPGDRFCSACGISLIPKDMPAKPKLVEEPITPKLELGSEPPTTPIIFEIYGKQLALPITSSLVIGRMTTQPGDACPDVGLNEFGAAVHGISRQHIRIIRKSDLVYVSDLNSLNGTCVNGRPLPRNCFRVLNSGDELQLGSLKLTLKF